MRVLLIAVFAFALAGTSCQGEPTEDEAPAQVAAMMPECAATQARIDSTAAVARAAEKAFGGFGIETQYTVTTVRRDSLGYLIRLTVIDVPGAIFMGGPGVIRVCDDGTAVIKTIEVPVESVAEPPRG